MQLEKRIEGAQSVRKTLARCSLALLQTNAQDTLFGFLLRGQMARSFVLHWLMSNGEILFPHWPKTLLSTREITFPFEWPARQSTISNHSGNMESFGYEEDCFACIKLNHQDKVAFRSGTWISSLIRRDTQRIVSASTHWKSSQLGDTDSGLVSNLLRTERIQAMLIISSSNTKRCARLR